MSEECGSKKSRKGSLSRKWGQAITGLFGAREVAGDFAGTVSVNTSDLEKAEEEKGGESGEGTINNAIDSSFNGCTIICWTGPMIDILSHQHVKDFAAISGAVYKSSVLFLSVFRGCIPEGRTAGWKGLCVFCFVRDMASLLPQRLYQLTHSH